MPNPRQSELEQQLKNMITLARVYVNKSLDQNKNPYTEQHDLDLFLAEFRTTYFASEYASKRYFKDFETLGFFSSLKSVFIIEPAIRNNRHGINFPEPTKEHKPTPKR